eukprot:791666_1
MGSHHCAHLSDMRLEIDENGDILKKEILNTNATAIADKVFSQSKSERKQLWKDIGGMKGAHLLSFHFYRRIYENDKSSKQQKNTKLKGFCSLFTDRPFAQAVDRVSRFMATELDGDVSFWNVNWVNNVHCCHQHAGRIVSPLFGQMWISFICSAFTDMDWNDDTKQRILVFFKDCMVFLFMDTWTKCKEELQELPMVGLVNEDKSRIRHWEHQYEVKKHD